MVIDGVRPQDDIVNVSLRDSTMLWELLDGRSSFTQGDDLIHQLLEQSRVLAISNGMNRHF